MTHALVVGFCAGPGAGKSTMAADVFARLKWAGIRAELVTEFVKEVYWEQRPLPDPLYSIGKQYHRLARVVPHVDVVVTDAPLVLGLAYTVQPELQAVIASYAARFRNFYIVLRRAKPYDPVGRYQGELAAIGLDAVIEDALLAQQMRYSIWRADQYSAPFIVEAILRRLEADKHASQS